MAQSTIQQNKWYQKLWEVISSPIINVLKSGLTLESIALSFALGISCGVFPIPGVTSIVGALFVWMLKANLVASTALNYLMTPFNLMLMVPFIRAGEYLFNVKDPIQFSMEPFSQKFFKALSHYSGALSRAVFVWLILLGPSTYILYILLKIILRPFIKPK